ncbi:MAG: Ig-like domain-containing protein, partial [Chloroflexota bacterium]
MFNRLLLFSLVAAMLAFSLPATLAQEKSLEEGGALDLESNLLITEVLPADDTTEISTRTPITVVFNRPVVPLTILEERDQLPDPLTIQPAIAGKGEWINTSIYIFRPDVAMAGGTTYTITVSELESIDGMPLEPFSWSFSTQTPQIIERLPNDGDFDVRADEPVTLWFNQRMNEASVESAFRLVAEGSDNAVPGEFRWNEVSTQFTFVPSEPLVLDTFYFASIDQTQVFPLIGDNPLGVQRDQWSFLTVPLPAIISTSPRDEQELVDIYSGLSIEFASPMNPATIDEHIRIEPEPIEGANATGFYSDYNNRYRLNFGTAASTTYTITLEPGMEDVFGNRIEDAIVLQYTTRAFMPEYTLQVPEQIGFYNAYRETTELYLAYRNIDQIDLSLYTVDTQDILNRLTADRFNVASGYEPSPASNIRNWTIDASVVPQNQRRFDLLDMGSPSNGSAPSGIASCEGALPSRLQPGDLAIVATEPDPLRARESAPDGEVVELIYRGYQMPVLQGPLCIDEIPWYQVELRDGTLVWVAESAGDEYFIDVRTQADVAPVTVTQDDGGALAPGMYFLTARTNTPNATYRTSPSHFMMVSTANITLKYFVNGAVAWVTNVETGEPLANVPVQFYGSINQDSIPQAYGSAVTDTDGVARVDIERLDSLRDPMIAIVNTSDEFGISADRWERGIEPYEFSVGYSFEPEAYRAYLYTDRPIYRPNEPVYFRGILRQKEDVTYLQPDMDSIFVQIYDDRNNIIYDQSVPIDEYGMFHDTILLAEDAVLGSFYRIQAKVDNEDYRSLDTLYFSVAEFRTPEFQVSVTPDVEDTVQGDPLNALVEGRYFFGGGVSNANVTYAVQAQPYNFRYTGEGRYSFRSFRPYSYYSGFGYSYGQLASNGETTTDDSGNALIEIGTNLDSLPGENTTGSQTFTIEATVRDESGFSVSGRETAIVHEGLLYVGVGTDRYVGRVDEPLDVNVVTVDWDSLPVASQPVDVIIERWEWNTVRELDDSGRYVYRSETEQTEVARETITTDSEGRGIYAFTPPQGGVYRLVAITRDELGNELQSTRTIWASGRQYVQWRQENDRTIDLIADAEEYRVGDTARILITSPFQGTAQALVTVERDGVIRTDRLVMDTNSIVYELPITEDFAPNVFVSVMLVKGVDENNPVAGFRYGLTNLIVDAERKEVNIAIEPNVEQAQPRQTISYTVRTTDYKGDPVSAQVGVGLTDLAALSVVEPNSGLMMDRFYNEQRLAVRTSTPLTINADELTQQVTEEFKGGGGGGGGDLGLFTIRADFENTTLWQPDLVTDASGTATIEVTLPDNLTTWRMDARAVSFGVDTPFLVGQDTFDLISTLPLLVRPATPRFFVVDDESVLAAVVNNNTGEEQEVTSFVEATGVTFMDDNIEQTQTIPAGGRARFEWRVVAQDVEAVDVTFFSATADGQFTDASKPAIGQGDDRLLPVHKFRVRETVGTAGTLREEDRVTEGIQLPTTLPIVDGELVVSVDPSLASTTLDSLDYLRNFPHQCTEQTISRFLPNIMTFTALEELELDRPGLKDDLDEQVNIGLQMLYVRQNLDGGWGWYTRDESNILTSAYVIFGLHRAREAWYPVDQAVFTRGQQFLLENSALDQGSSYYRYYGRGDWQYNREAFALYAMAVSGVPDVARMSNL